MNIVMIVVSCRGHSRNSWVVVEDHGRSVGQSPNSAFHTDVEVAGLNKKFGQMVVDQRVGERNFGDLAGLGEGRNFVGFADLVEHSLVALAGWEAEGNLAELVALGARHSSVAPVETGVRHSSIALAGLEAEDNLVGPVDLAEARNLTGFVDFAEDGSGLVEAGCQAVEESSVDRIGLALGDLGDCTGLAGEDIAVRSHPVGVPVGRRQPEEDSPAVDCILIADSVSVGFHMLEHSPSLHHHQHYTAKEAACWEADLSVLLNQIH